MQADRERDKETLEGLQERWDQLEAEKAARQADRKEQETVRKIERMELARTIERMEQARTIVESEMVRAGLTLFGWRAVPVDPSVLGSHADAMRPNIEQILFRAPSGHDEAAVERELYLVRRRIEKRALAAQGATA